MKRIRYLTLLWALLFGLIARAQDDYWYPESPGEPGELVVTKKLTLLANPIEGGSVDGGGKVVPGTSVTISANANSDWKFVSWTDENGTVKSTDSYYTFEKGIDHETLTANFVYAPNAPGEPDDIDANCPHKLTLVAEEGGYVSGEGRYKNGTSVGIGAYANSTLFEFVGWYDEDGMQVSEEAYFNYIMGAKATTLTAKFKFVPESPDEPDELKNIYRLKLMAEEGGLVYTSNSIYRYQEGTSTTVCANSNSGYEFTGWYLDGSLYSSESSFEYTMTDNVEFVAHFKYVPDSPDEPEPAVEKQFSFTLYNVNCKPGDVIEYPVYLTCKENVTNMTFQLSFDERLNPDLDNVVLTESAAGYTVNRTKGTALTGNKAYIYTFTGGTLVTGSYKLLNISIPIPDDMVTGLYYPVTINQISMTKPDNTTQTAGARHGRVSVYKLGDSNGDNKVDIKDKINAISFLLGDSPKVFIKEVGDVNDDNEITVTDALVVDGLMEPSGDQGSE